MTEETEEQRAFAAAVLRNLLERIAEENRDGHDICLVSHAWTTGPLIHLVYSVPPSHTIGGLVRDTRLSLIDPGPWPDLDEAVRYYYLLDLAGTQPSEPADADRPDVIVWAGDVIEGLPVHSAELPTEHRCNTSVNALRPTRLLGRRSRANEVEPRRYADPPAATRPQPGIPAALHREGRAVDMIAHAGTVVSGAGRMKNRMAPGTQASKAFEEVTGTVLAPGTLNVRLPSPVDMPSAARKFTRPGADGDAQVYIAPATLNSINGFIVRAERTESGAGRHPKDVVEFICAINLREHLGLSDGDTVTITF
ncbi:DUF120 domain-containing protein [Mycolicibacterium sp.]|uniref:DUF120 domain-containing protein n=1 Tax=Mycolicibacterium sp. TaxID=2320850 RepID=UPI0037C90953